MYQSTDVSKVCPWCGGSLQYHAAFPVLRLVAGPTRTIKEDEVPEHLRRVPAWTCATPMCRYRERA
ncbi:MAG TPA: hypothetical protein VFX12_15165 [Vicinamibacterales bacterium]|nr:hypothetical protein [Vicinamibacterales bacterium]